MKKIENNNKKFINLLGDIEEGNLFIPNFQREYIWSKNKIVQFLNSIINTEPFGCLLIWSPKDKQIKIETRNKIFESILKKEGEDKKDYLIDGQQRITSLLSIKKAKQLIKKWEKEKNKPTGWNNGKIIFFDYINKEFTLDKTIENKISLIDFFKVKNHSAKKELLFNFESLNEEEINEYIDNFENAKNTIDNLEIPTIKLINHSLDEVIQIFSNINTKGAKLTNFDLIHAKWSNLKQRENDKEVIFDFEGSLKDQISKFDFGYDKLEREIFVDSLYLILDDENPMYSSEEKINFMINSDNSDQYIKKFNENLLATKKVFEFLKGKNMQYKFLPSKIIFKWLTYFYVKKGSKIIHGKWSDIIMQYIKYSAINDRYRSGTLEKLKKDIKFVDEVLLKDDVEKSWAIWQEQTLKEYFEKQELILENLKHVSYKTSSIIANYIKFLLSSTTESFIENKVCASDDNIDIHHIFPKNSIIAKENPSWKNDIDSIINTTPLTKDENKYISNKNPSKYIFDLEKKSGERFNKILLEHGIDKNHLEYDDFVSFFNDRANWLLKKINESF
ncbi:MAG: GmrSD restriction endonuclease domain-containing protein [Metamycoplasmataceae bacterium]